MISATDATRLAKEHLALANYPANIMNVIDTHKAGDNWVLVFNSFFGDYKIEIELDGKDGSVLRLGQVKGNAR